MGRSFNVNHIYNPDKLTKAQFKKKFTDSMKAKGYTKASADDGEISYALVFSADRSWVTVLTEESTDTRKEAAELAKNFDLQVLSVELVDSDFAEITLVDKSGIVDTMYLGEQKTLDITVIPEDAANTDLTFSTSDPSVISVDENGKLTANAVGTSVITVAASDGSGAAAIAPEAPGPWTVRGRASGANRAAPASQGAKEAAERSSSGGWGFLKVSRRASRASAAFFQTQLRMSRSRARVMPT